MMKLTGITSLVRLVLVSGIVFAQSLGQSQSLVKDLVVSPQLTYHAQARCSTNKQCIAAHAGEPYICQQATRTCVRLTSPECTVLAEETDIANDNTVWLGLVTIVRDRPLRQIVVDFARREFVKVGSGLPPAKPGGPRRPYAFVSCDSAKGIDPIFKHLIGELNLPAIIGPNYSSDTLHALTKYALPAKTVMLATPTAAVFTTTTTDGLFLRTLASDAWQGKVLALLFNQFVERELKSTGVLAPGEQTKIFLAYRDDVYGQSISNILRSELRFNGKTPAANGDRFQIADYGDPNDPNKTSDAKYASIAAKILAMQPHVIAIIGSVEAEKIIRTVEQQWPTTSSFRPRWIGSESVSVAMVRVGALEPSLPQRFLHANVRINFESSIARSLLYAIAAEHSDVVKRDPRSPSALGLYDSVYAMAYAIASLGDEPLTGPKIAAALRQLNKHGAPFVNVGRDGILDIYERIEKRQTFDLQGVSGSLDWDQNGDVVQDFDILCMKTISTNPGSPVEIGIKPSGLHYDVRRNRFVGNVNCPKPVAAHLSGRGDR